MPQVLSIGTIIRSRYKVAQVIWEAQLINVYYVQDLHMPGKSWVVREMQMVAVDEQDINKIISNFQQEAHQLSSLSHPSLATVIDFFQEGKNLYIVREYVNGMDLYSLIMKNQKPFSEAEVIMWSVELADVLAYLYSKRLPAIFFREFNVKNMIRTADGSIKLIDLGLAKVFQIKEDEESSKRMGSLDYAAPEQFTVGGAFESRSLVYSLGAFMYHALTTVNPASSPFDLKPINILNPTLSKKTQELIRIATSINPKNRYQSLYEMKKELTGIARNPRSFLESGIELRENGILNWILGIIALLALGTLIYLLFIRH